MSLINLSNCMNLEVLYCSDNNISSIDLSSCINLKDLDCSDNNISRLIIHNNTTYIMCYNNQITLFNFTKLSTYHNLICNHLIISNKSTDLHKYLAKKYFNINKTNNIKRVILEQYSNLSQQDIINRLKLLKELY